MNPSISIIIPVYNVKPYLRECLDSIHAQTFRDWECICVDDGSTDGSPAILDEYAQKDSRVRVIHRAHTNAGACRNAGLAVAGGEFLLFLDSDDVFSKRMFGSLLDAIRRHSADIATCGIATFRNGERRPLPFPFRPFRPVRVHDRPAETVDVFSRWAGRAWDKMFRRSFVEANGLRFQELRSTNDALFTYSALSLSSRIAALPDRLVAHRLNPSSLEATRSASPLDVVSAMRAIHAALTERNVFAKSPPLERRFKRWVVRILFWTLDTIDSVEAYERVHESFRQLRGPFGLDELTADDFPGDPRLYERLAPVLDGCSPAFSLRENERHLDAVLGSLQKTPLRRLLSGLKRRFG